MRLLIIIAIVCCACAAWVTRIILNSIPKIGVNHVTISDVIAMYFWSLILVLIAFGFISMGIENIIKKYKK